MRAAIADAGAVIPGSRKELAALRADRPEAREAPPAAGRLLPPRRLDALAGRPWAAQAAPAANVALARALAEHVAAHYRAALRALERRAARLPEGGLALHRYTRASAALRGLDAVDAILRAGPLPAEALCVERDGNRTWGASAALAAWSKAHLGASLEATVERLFPALDPDSPFNGQGPGEAAGVPLEELDRPALDVVCRALGQLMAGQDGPMRARAVAARGDGGAWSLATVRHGVADDPVDDGRMLAPGRVVRLARADGFPAGDAACRALAAAEGALAQRRRLQHGEIGYVRHGGEAVIGVPLPNGLHLPLERIPDAGIDAARAHVRAHYGRLCKRADRLRRVPALRQATPQVRLGPDHRPPGASITPEAFLSKFGFRGIQWGNWVRQAERQDFLNHGHDALMDLADALGLPPRALSLGESLGIAFGARGRGGTKAPYAHYERLERVINLTKGNGYGTLAHEWLHALDSHVGRALTGRPDAMLSELASAPGQAGDEFALVVARLATLTGHSALARRSREMDKGARKPYYGTAAEIAARAFEGAVAEALEGAGRRNHLLVLFSSPESCPTAFWEEREGADSYPYPLPGELDGGIREKLAGMVEAGVGLLSPSHGPIRQPFRPPRAGAPAAPAEPAPDADRGRRDAASPWRAPRQVEMGF